jgi:hypothetical protein
MGEAGVPDGPQIKRKGGLKKIVRSEVKRQARLVLERYYREIGQKQPKHTLNRMVSRLHVRAATGDLFH